MESEQHAISSKKVGYTVLVELFLASILVRTKDASFPHPSGYDLNTDK